ncbi:MAG: AEC family transporter [Candidatus Hydrogenedentota bacterium]
MNISYKWLVVFLAILIGFVAGKIRKFNVEDLSVLVVNYLLPFYVFLSIVGVNIIGSNIFYMIFSAFFVIFFSTVFIVISGKILGIDFSSYMLPVVFMNSGFLGIPIIESLFGYEKTSLAIIYDQTQSVLIFTLGLSIAGSDIPKRERLKVLLINPVLFAILLGIIFNLTGLSLPQYILNFISFPAKSALPVALVTLGISLSSLKLENLLFISGGVLFRYFFGLFFASLFILLFSPPKEIMPVILILSATPSAVMSYLISEECKKGASFAASTVFVSTLLYPLFLFLILKYITIQ